MIPYIKTIPSKEHIREDSYFVNQDVGIYIAADGLGGPGGAKGSALAASLLGVTLESELKHNPESYTTEEQMRQLMTETAIEVNKKVSALNGRSTVSCLVLKDNKAYTLNIGDSRIYHVQAKLNMPEVEQITKDHSLEQLMVDYDNANGGNETIEEHLVKNINSGPMFYMGKELFSDVPVIENGSQTRKDMDFEDIVEINVHDYGQHDKFLVTTDGLTSRVTNKEISKIITDYLSTSEKEFVFPSYLLEVFTETIENPKEMLEIALCNAYKSSELKGFIANYIGNEEVDAIQRSGDTDSHKKKYVELLVDNLPTNTNLRKKVSESLKFDDTVMIWVDTDNIEAKLLKQVNSLYSSQDPLLEKVDGWIERIEKLRDDKKIYLIDHCLENLEGASIETKVESLLTAMLDSSEAIHSIYTQRENDIDADDLHQYIGNLAAEYKELSSQIEALEKEKKEFESIKEKLKNEKATAAKATKMLIDKIEGLYVEVSSHAVPLNSKVGFLINQVGALYKESERKYQEEVKKNERLRDVIKSYQRFSKQTRDSSVVSDLSESSAEVGSLQSSLNDLVPIVREEPKQTDFEKKKPLHQLQNEAHGDFDTVSRIYERLPDSVQKRMKKKRDGVESATKKIINFGDSQK